MIRAWHNIWVFAQMHYQPPPPLPHMLLLFLLSYVGLSRTDVQCGFSAWQTTVQLRNEEMTRVPDNAEL